MTTGENRNLLRMLPHCAVTTVSMPLDDMVVSKYANGSVASRYGDLEWDWTPYNHSGSSSTLNFRFWKRNDVLTTQRSDLVSEIRWLLYSVITHSRSSYAFNTLARYLRSLRSIAIHCEQVGISVRSLIADTGLLWAYVSMKTDVVVHSLR